MSTTTLQLAKQNFKFSAAHFLIFDEKHAEKLHGHNYQVKVDLEVSAGTDLQAQGYFVDFNVFKKYIKDRLDQWDEIVLLPKLHPEMKFKDGDKGLEVTFRDRFYVFPKNEVLLLEVSNTSVENLSRLLAEDFIKAFKSYGVAEIAVSVEETLGQAALTRIKA